MDGELNKATVWSSAKSYEQKIDIFKVWLS